MTVAVPAPDFARASGFDVRWQRHAAMLGAVWGALLLLFRGDAADLARIYWTNTTFGHCLFVAPVIGWLVWQRRRELALVAPVGWWPGLALVAVGGFGWLLGDAAGVALFRHAGLIVMLQGAAVSVLGPNVARALLFPLAYMLFLIPFGEAFEGPLQDVTVAMTMPLLHAAGVPATVDGVLITTPNGYFEVAEACSGAKFFIAMLAFGTLTANVCYVSWPRRAVFLGVALVVPVIANGLRAFGTIYAAWWTSVEEATGMDHIVYGWVFFAAVMAAVLAIGWRWFDRDPDAAWFDPARLPGRAAPQVGGAGGVAAGADGGEPVPRLEQPGRVARGAAARDGRAAAGSGLDAHGAEHARALVAQLPRRRSFPDRPLFGCAGPVGGPGRRGLCQPARGQGAGRLRHRRDPRERPLGAHRGPARAGRRQGAADDGPGDVWSARR